MDLNLIKENINFKNAVYNTSFTHEETAEMIVPDAQPDIFQIINASAAVLLRSKEADYGRVQITGIICSCILYIPEGGAAAKRLELNIPFSAVTEDESVDPGCNITAMVSLNTIDAKAINPRKILVRADVVIEVSCYKDFEFAHYTTDENDSTSGIEILKETCEISSIASISEKTFVISDEFKTMPAKASIAEILRSDVKIVNEETKCVGKKLIFKGTVLLSLLYRSEKNNEIGSCEFSSVFSQIMEIDTTGEGSGYDLQIMPTGIYVSIEKDSPEGEKSVDMEIHAVAQCTVSSKYSISYITDMYSTRFEAEAISEEISVMNMEGKSAVTETLRETISALSAVKNVLMSSIRTGPVYQKINSGKLELTSSAEVSIMYIAEEGQVAEAAQKFSVKTVIDAKEGYSYITSSAASGEMYITVSNSGFDIRLPIRFTIQEYCSKNIAVISKITYNENLVRDFSNRPSIIVYRYAGKESLWELSKKYISSPENIMSANEIKSEEDIAAGQLLIIPKKR